jgi:hypothetical protein
MNACLKILLLTASLLTACLLQGCASLEPGYAFPEPPISPLWHRS